VAAQFALTLVLANAAALMLQSYFELRHREYGFSTENVVTLGFAIQGPEYDDQNNFITFYNEVLERVDGLPGVRHAAAANKLPLEGGTNNSVPEADGHDFSETDSPIAEMSIVSDDYFQSIGIPLLSGRGFNEEAQMDGNRHRW
jgi:putative ABC transport system permease protein